MVADQRKQAEAAGFKIDHVVADEGVSGVSIRLAERPQGRRLFDLLRAGDTLVVRWVDRLGRNYADVCDTIRDFMRRDMVIRTVINGMIVEVGLYGYDSTSDVAEQVGEVSHRFAACTIGCVKFPTTVWSQRSPATEPRDMFPTTDTALNRCGDAARYTAASRVPAIRLPWIITPSAGRITARSRIPTKLGAPTLHERSFPDTVTSCTDSMSTPCPAVSLVSTLPEITRCAPAPPEWCTTRIAEPLTLRRRIVLLATTTRSATLLKS